MKLFLPGVFSLLLLVTLACAKHKPDIASNIPECIKNEIEKTLKIPTGRLEE